MQQSAINIYLVQTKVFLIQRPFYKAHMLTKFRLHSLKTSQDLLNNQKICLSK